MNKEFSILGYTNSIVTALLALTALLGTTLFLAGYSFKAGYLSAFGIGPDAIPVQWQDSLAEAFTLGILAIGKVIANFHWVFLIIFGFPLLFLLLLLLFGKRMVRLIRRLNFWVDQQGSEADKAGTMQRGVRVILSDMKPLLLTFLFGSLAFLGFSLVVMFKPYLTGQAEGRRQIELFQSVAYDCQQLGDTGLHCGELVNIVNERIFASGLVISSGAQSHIALYNGRHIQIFQRSPDLKFLIRTDTAVTEPK